MLLFNCVGEARKLRPLYRDGSCSEESVVLLVEFWGDQAGFTQVEMYVLQLFSE